MTRRVYKSRYRLHKTVHQLPRAVHHWQRTTASGAGAVELIIVGHSIPPLALPSGCQVGLRLSWTYTLHGSSPDFVHMRPLECDAFDDRNSLL